MVGVVGVGPEGTLGMAATLAGEGWLGQGGVESLEVVDAEEGVDARPVSRLARRRTGPAGVCG